MSVVAWPGHISPGLRPFHIKVPSGWAAAETPSALLTLLGPEVRGFRANLVVDGRRLPIAVAIEPLAERAFGHCDPRTMVGPVLDLGDDQRQRAVAIRRGVATAGELRLVHLVAVTTATDLSPTGLRSVYTLIGTCLMERAGTDEATLTSMIASFATVPVEAQTNRVVTDASRRS